MPLSALFTGRRNFKRNFSIEQCLFDERLFLHLAAMDGQSKQYLVLSCDAIDNGWVYFAQSS